MIRKLPPFVRQVKQLPYIFASSFLQQCCKPSSCNLLTTHSHAIIDEYDNEILNHNRLLKGYSDSSHLDDARKLFDAMPLKNLISWSLMIAMCTQHGYSYEAISFFLEYRRSSEAMPNDFVLSSVLRACVQLNASGFTVQVHGLAMKLGLHEDLYVGTALLNSYMKIGYLDEATSLFCTLPIRNSLSWTSMIKGFSMAGISKVSLKWFASMIIEGVKPDLYTLSTVVSASCALEFLEGGRQIHGYMLRSVIETDVSMSNSLIDLYSKCSRVDIARKLFDCMVSKNLISWTTMIGGYKHNLCDAEAVSLFLEMSRSGWSPDSFACSSILNCCGSLSAIKPGRSVHAHVIKADIYLDEFVINALLDMYAKCGSVCEARVIFDDFAKGDTVTYNAMIEAYAKSNELIEVLGIFNKMRCGSLYPTVLTYVPILAVASKLSEVEVSKQIHCLLVKEGLLSDLFATTSLVDSYSKCSLVDEARTVFDVSSGMDIALCNAMISCYAQNDRGGDAIKLFQCLSAVRMKPNVFTYVALLAIGNNQATMSYGSEVHCLIVKSGVEMDQNVSNALMDMYAKCGCIRESLCLLKLGGQKDVICWNSVISLYAQHGHAEEALKIFQLMNEKQIEPNHVTFIALLSACSHAGLVDEGLQHFYSMREKYNLEPEMEHYASVVSLLGRSGKLFSAKEFIIQMPTEPAAVVWRSLLSACRLFGDAEMGKYAAEMAVHADPTDSGPYVLLSNIYADKGMWPDVEQLRKGMDCAGTLKEAGYSWIEIMDRVHVFISRGTLHEQADMIYSVLDELVVLLKDVGYVSDMPELRLLDEIT